MNQITEKAQIGMGMKYREFLEKLRDKIMRAYPMKKHYKAGDLLEGSGMVGSTLNWLQELGAIKDMSEPGTTMRDGKLWKWTYDNTENGVVDGVLVNSLIEKKRVYEKNYREQKRAGNMQITAVIEESLRRLPTKKDDKIDLLEIWFQDKLKKNEITSGYLRADEAITYQRVLDVFQGLKELKQALNKLNI